MKTFGPKFLMGLLLGCLLPGCAATSLTSYSDPAFTTTSYWKFAVMVGGLQLDERQALENRLVGALRNKAVAAESTMRLFPPTREVSDDEVSSALLADGYDALLYVQRVDAGSKIEPSWTQIFGGSASGNTAEHLYAAFDTRLVDLRSGQVAWIASAKTGGSEYAGVAEVVDSFASRTADALEEKQLLAIRPRSR